MNTSPAKPLCRAFNVAVMTMAQRLFPMGFDVSADAPATLEALTAHYEKTGRFLISNLYSAKTIYACPETNHHFRAWHDWTHWHLQAPFEDSGERHVCEHQKRQLRERFSPGAQTDRFCRLIHFEIIEQLEYKNTFGQFPNDQMALAIALGYS